MNKKRFKKGEMLVETVVAMAVFLIMAVTFFSVYKSFSHASKREAAYIFFESECISIDSYYDSLGMNHETGDDYWAQDFFGKYYHRATEYEDGVAYQIVRQRYNSSFEKINYENMDFKYELVCKYKDGKMIANVEDKEDGYFIIDNLDFGQSEADYLKDNQYIREVAEKNIEIRKLDPDEERYFED